MTAYLFHLDPPADADPGDELSIQIALRKALKKQAPLCRLAGIPNGAQRTIWAAMKAKQEGMTPGFADCIVQWPGGGIAFVELKTRTGTLSEQQHIWMNWQSQAGFNVGVFRSVSSCLAWLEGLGAPVATKDGLRRNGRAL